LRLQIHDYFNMTAKAGILIVPGSQAMK